MRISLFVDGGNFFYMQKRDLGWWIDPRKLLDYVRSKGDLNDANYYVGKDAHPEARQDKYLKALTYMGYSLITKDLKMYCKMTALINKRPTWISRLFWICLIR